MTSGRQRNNGGQRGVEMRFLEGVRARCPDNVRVLEALGDLYTKVGKYGEGLDVDLQVVKLRPHDETAWYNLACSFALTGRHDEAIAALRKAVKLGYRDFRWMKKDADLKSLHSDPRFLELVAGQADLLFEDEADA